MVIEAEQQRGLVGVTIERAFGKARACADIVVAQRAVGFDQQRRSFAAQGRLTSSIADRISPKPAACGRR